MEQNTNDADRGPIERKPNTGGLFIFTLFIFFIMLPLLKWWLGFKILTENKDSLKNGDKPITGGHRGQVFPTRHTQGASNPNRGAVSV